MRFSKYAPAVLLPTAAIASANPDIQDGVTLIAVEGVTQEDVHLLVRRQLDLGGIVDGISDLLGPLFDLLSSESLKKINLIITNLASVLGDLDVPQTRDLLTLLDELINSDATQDLIDTLGSLLPTLLDLLDSDLITKLTNILNNASILLTRDVAEQLNDLITSIGPLFNYIGEFIAFFLDLIFGGGSGGGGGGGGGASSTTTRPPTATDTEGPSSTGDRDDPDYSLTLTGGSDSPEATETSGFDWWDSLGLGSSSNSNDDDDTDSPSATGDSDSDSGSGWDLGFSNSSDDDDSETVTGGSGEEEDSAGSSDDPGFTGAAGRLQLGAGVSGIVGALITILLL